MLKDATVFVLGAAFSKEVGLPLGEGLKEKILGVLPTGPDGGGDQQLRHLLNLQGNPQWYDAATTLRVALPFAASIDNLVEHHQNDPTVVQVAKWAIATAIASEEVSSWLGEGQRRKVVKLNEINRMEASGYHDFFRLIVSGVPAEGLAEAFSRLKIVTFNYDRTLEAFLIRAVAAHSARPIAEAREIVANATILHAYGKLDAEGAIEAAPSLFRSIMMPGQIEQLARGLRTFSEKRISGEDEPIQLMMANAQRIIFLGCAFHRQNLRLIRPPSIQAESVYGTVYVPAPVDPAGHAAPSIYSFSEPTILNLTSVFTEWTNGQRRPSTYLDALTCRQLIAKHGTDWTH